MGNVPVVQEATTAISSVGHLVTGDTEGAGRCWDDYSQRSVAGSGILALHHRIHGNEAECAKAREGCIRASCNMVAVSRSIPVLHEIAVASDSLGDLCMGDTAAARDRWAEYAHNSVGGAGVHSIVALSRGDKRKAQDLLQNCGKKALAAGMEAAVVAATAVTAGAAAPLGVGAAAACTALATSAASTGAAVGSAALDGREIKAGEVVGAALNGAAAGALAGTIAGRSAARTTTATAASSSSELGVWAEYYEAPAKPSIRSAGAPGAGRPVPGPAQFVADPLPIEPHWDYHVFDAEIKAIRRCVTRKGNTHRARLDAAMKRKLVHEAELQMRRAAKTHVIETRGAAAECAQHNAKIANLERCVVQDAAEIAEMDRVVRQRVEVEVLQAEVIVIDD